MRAEIETVSEIGANPVPGKKLESQFVVCVKNDGYKASLELRKIYQILPDAVATSHRMLRVIDETGEDYLYPADLFTPIAGESVYLDGFRQ
jgi:hypothetical protein